MAGNMIRQCDLKADMPMARAASICPKGTARNAPFIWAFGVPGVGYLVESTMFGGAPVFGWFWARATPLPFSSGNWAPATSSLGLEPMGVLITLVVASGLFVAAVFARRHFREI